MSSNITPEQGFKIFDALSSENLQINPFYIKIAGSITGGYLLTQLVYLFKGVYHYQEFFKKDSYFKEKLLLSEWELRAQKKELVKRGLIAIRLGKGKISHYIVNVQRIIEMAVDKFVDKPVDNKLINCESVDLKTRIPQIQKRGILVNLYKEQNTKQELLCSNIISAPLKPESLKKPPITEGELETIQNLVDLGIKTRLARTWVSKFGLETVRNKIKMLQEEISSGFIIERRGGWLKCALEQNWGHSENGKDSIPLPPKKSSSLYDISR